MRDVPISGQHQGFGFHGLITSVRGGRNRSEADFNLSNLQNVDRNDAFEWSRQMIMQARIDRSYVLSEPLDEPFLGWADGVNACGQIDADDQGDADLSDKARQAAQVNLALSFLSL